MSSSAGGTTLTLSRDPVTTLSLFPTPVSVTVLSETDALNKCLAAFVLEREPSESQGQRNAPFWRSGDLQDEIASRAPALLTAIRQLATRSTSGPDGGPVEPQWRMTCRASVLRAGQSIPVHCDLGAFWSACYLIDDGGTAANPALGGTLELQDPRGAAPVMIAPNLTFAFPDGLMLGISQTVSAGQGAAILFPAWLLRGVGHYGGDGARISLDFTLSA